MVAVSGGLIFIGYQLMTYGWSQVNGSNAGFFDLLWPGRYSGNTPDKGATSTSAPGSSNAYKGTNPTIKKLQGGFPPLPKPILKTGL